MTRSDSASPVNSASLAIVGASTRSAAASAVRAGFQPIAADLFADADLRRIATATRISPYPEGFVDWLRAIEPPAWMYTGALENHPELVDQMAWIAPLWGNPGDVLARVRSPWELSEVLCGCWLVIPGNPPDARRLAARWLVAGEDVSRRERQRRAGVGRDKETRRQGDEETFGYTRPNLLAPLLSPCLVYQRRIAGMPCAAVFVAAEGAATLLGVTRQLIGEAWLGAHGFQYAGSIGPWPIADGTRATLVRLGNVLAEQFELIGLFGVDFILGWRRGLDARGESALHGIRGNRRAIQGVERDRSTRGRLRIATPSEPGRPRPRSGPRTARLA